MSRRPVRLQLSRRKGFDLQALSLSINGLPAVNVARPSKWGNPFIVGRDGKRKDCVLLYRCMLGGYLCLTSKASVDEQKQYILHAHRALRHLRGKNLSCWCPLPKAGEIDMCHAAILLRVANK